MTSVLSATRTDSQREHRQVIVLEEHETREAPAELLAGQDLTVYSSVINNNLVRFFFRGERLMLQAGPLVGVIPLNDHFILDVRPRFHIPNLNRLLFLSDASPDIFDEFTRKYKRTDSLLPSLLDLVSQSLIGGIRKILATGLHHDYIQMKEQTSFPRGRILLTETILRQHIRNQIHVATSIYHTRTRDTWPNRHIKYAVWSLAERYRRMQPRKGTRKISRELNEIFHALSDVTLVTRRQLGSKPQLSGIEGKFSTYKSPLALADLIIRNQGISFEPKAGDLILSSLFLRMDKLFEQYIRTLLDLHSREAHLDLVVKDGNRTPPDGGAKSLFDSGSSEKATPDVVLYRKSSNNPLGIIEVKYKSYDRTPTREDLNQIITYAVSYRSSIAVLVHPANAFVGLRNIGAIGELMVFQYALDLSSQLLESEENKFVTAIATLLS